MEFIQIYQSTYLSTDLRIQSSFSFHYCLVGTKNKAAISLAGHRCYSFKTGQSDRLVSELVSVWIHLFPYQDMGYLHICESHVS